MGGVTSGECCCMQGVKGALLSKSTETMSQKEFEQCVDFLGKVPLFQLQLPRAERPRIALALKRIKYNDDEKIIQQGEEGTTFFLMMKGRASVFIAADGMQVETAELTVGDHFGGRTLNEKRSNVATIVARGPVETLTMSREDFERLGLNQKIKFPQRPAIFEGRRVNARHTKDADGRDRFLTPEMEGGEEAIDGADHNKPDVPKSQEEIDFLCRAISQNPNLRALTDMDEQTILHVARQARQRQVQSNSEVARSGELGSEFFIIAKGSFEVIFSTSAGDRKDRSAEAMVERHTMCQRLVRKQHFMAAMLQSQQIKDKRRRVSSRAASAMVHGSDSPEQFDRSPCPKKLASDDDIVDTIRRHKNKSIGDFYGDFSFKMGDHVECLLARQVSGTSGIPVGRIVAVDTARDGEVLVEFPGEEPKMYNVDHLNLVEKQTCVGMLNPGDSFGELSLLYNTRREATVKARENSTIYAIERRLFKACFNRAPPQINDFAKLLDEVPMFQQLLASERYELARNAVGLETFSPGQKLITDGKTRNLPHFYIIDHGDCIVSKADKELVRLGRAGCFGERAIIRGDEAAEEDVLVGSEGMTCLAIAGEILKSLPMRFDGSDLDKGVPDVHVPISEYYRYIAPSDSLSQKARGNMLDLNLNDLLPVAKLGGGGFGEVFLVMHKEGQEYALKKCSKSHISRNKAKRQIISERDTLLNCDSPFIVKLFQTFKDSQFVYMLLEPAHGGELYQLLVDHPRVLKQDKPRGSASLFYIACMAEAIGHMHERCIAYRDLKLENVLLDKDGYIKLCDMGFARFVLGKTHTMLGTPQYLAPEMIDFPHAHDLRVDWWALGVIAFEMLTLQSPWDNQGHDGNDIMAELLGIRRSHEIGPDLSLIPSQMFSTKDFIQRLLLPDPARRLGGTSDILEIREHAWPVAAEFDWDALVRRELRAPYTPKKARVLEQADFRAKQVSLSATSTNPSTPRSPASPQASRFYEEGGEADTSWADTF